MARPFFIDQDEGAFVVSATDSSRLQPAEFFNGDSNDVEFYFLRKTGISGAPYIYEDKTGATLKVGIGNPREAITAGTFTVTFGADTTTALAYNASAAVVETAINALASIISAGGVTVEKINMASRYRITFDDAGAQGSFTVNPASLIPDVSAIVSERVAGDGSTREVQEILLACDPAAFQDSFTDLPTTVTASISTITAGSSTTSEVQRIAFSPKAAGGTWSITLPQDTRTQSGAVVAGVFITSANHGFVVGQPVVMTGFTTEANFTEGVTYYVAAVSSPTRFTISATVDGSAIATATADAGAGTITTPARTTSEIAAGANQSDVQTALQALDTVGADNVTVSGIAGEYFTLSFTGEKANADLPAVTVEDGSLTAPYGKTGELDLSTFGLMDLFDAAGDDSLSLKLEVQITESGSIQTYAASVELTEDVIKAGATGPTEFPGSFATLSTFNADSTSSAEEIEFSKLAPETKTQTLRLTVAAGAGTYTTKVFLPTTDAVAGDISRIVLVMDASTNPTIEIRNDTAAGTLLYTQVGTGAAFILTYTFTYSGTAWTSDQ